MTSLRYLLYDVGVAAYGLAMRLATGFHPKARLWVLGRRGVLAQAAPVAAQPGPPWVWFHCASLGEFEQGRNLIDALAGTGRYRILLTFYSPSGYEIRKNYPRAQAVMYLPLDTPRHAQVLLDLFRPVLAVFVKYELWLRYLQALAQRGIPFFLISARMGADSPFLRSMLAPLYRRAFGQMTRVYTQDTATAALLAPLCPPGAVRVSGDTRYDRVLANREGFQPIPAIERFVGGRRCLVAGSTWPRDEALLLEAYAALRDKHDLCMILAPHEIHPERIQAALAQDPGERLAFSRIDDLQPGHRILWIDNIGMLSRLYAYAAVAYVGGGWGTGLHNILEAATFGCPVVFGPDHAKFPEAGELIAADGARAIDSAAALTGVLDTWLHDETWLADVQVRNRQFVDTRAGATAMILEGIYEVLEPTRGRREM
ncbi:MAG: glycosyltransferase N-terminal domain-containing protein [Bacteroidia bacterium]